MGQKPHPKKSKNTFSRSTIWQMASDPPHLLGPYVTNKKRVGGQKKNVDFPRKNSVFWSIKIHSSKLNKKIVQILMIEKRPVFF